MPGPPTQTTLFLYHPALTGQAAPSGGAREQRRGASVTPEAGAGAGRRLGGAVAWAGALKCACRCAYGHAWEEPGCPGTGGPTTTGGVVPGLCRAGL